jgi:hypothetical protein
MASLLHRQFWRCFSVRPLRIGVKTPQPNQSIPIARFESVVTFFTKEEKHFGYEI